jgi:tol-pal system protein YbgF
MNIRSLDWRLLSLRGGQLAAAGVLTLCALTAQAGLLEDDEARKAILELRQRVESLRQSSEGQTSEVQRKSNEEIQALRRSLVDLQNQIETLRSDVATLRGQLEQQQREGKELQRRLTDQAKGNDERLRALEPVKVSVDGREFVVEPAERRDFETALNQFKKGEFAAVQPLWVEFLRRYPQSGYRSTALFWLGNAQYATRDYREAIQNFRLLLSSDATHLRAAETLLSIANCQTELKDPKAARKTLDELVKAHPQSEAAAAAKERLSKSK